ncbi:MBL fold metallo-hydrolase [Cupriavidus sp. WKF15]|uniref:MBL fold metallo-hydrolase n=1 Tax=Cupriavidus sp. WKF15 TaxID=3032282 RepID=UPI0023E2FAA2|nr:MBL fold metallo-hydrolase [Cupriavidus sp. WKF15]WER44647.1 MBL fold metallo-hydrolase [Cupriavidus sp. WKF15]
MSPILKQSDIMFLRLSSLFVLASASVAIQAASPASTGTLPVPRSGIGWESRQAPGFYRFRLGAFRITALSDGTAQRDVAKIMSNPSAVREAYATANLALPIEISVNCYLIDTGERRLLVDTGAGELFGPQTGRLVANLRAAGYEPSDIDDVLLTHIHGDHSGGLSIGGQRVFPNATVHVDRRDPALWLSAEAEAKAPPAARSTYRQSHQTVDPYAAAGRLKTFDGATQLYPGIRAVPLYGHTPGMSGYFIESQGQRLLLWGDIIHASEVQFRNPAITIDYDVDRAEAAATRLRVLTDASREGYLVGGAHVTFPGIGRVRAECTGFSWVPEPCSVTLGE